MPPRGPVVRRGLLVLVAVAASAGVAVGASAGDSDPCARYATASAARANLVTGSGPEVLVVGDSWSVGLDLTDPADSWPARLAGEVHVAGFSGSGFSRRASDCGDVSFATRADGALTASTELVVIEGGLNDVDRSDAEIAAGFARLVRVLGDRPVVVVGPAAAPSRADRVARVDALLATLTAAAGWRYVATYDWELAYLPDRLHLTVSGHARFGELVAAAVGRASPGRSAAPQTRSTPRRPPARAVGGAA